MDKAYLLSININDGSSQAKRWEPPEPISSIESGLARGEQTAEQLDAIPGNQALVIERLVKGRVPDVLGWSTGPFVVSSAIREFLELHEPNVHHFLPIEVHTQKPVGGKVAQGAHWLLLAPPVVDCLDLANTVMAYDVQGQAWSREKDNAPLWGGGIPRTEDDRCMLYGASIDGRHLWRVQDGADKGRARYACSPEFWAFFKASKMLGWKTDKACAVI